MNCINCKYINIDEEKFSKYCENYVCFGCQIKGETNYVHTDDTKDDKDFICEHFELKGEN